MGLVNDRLIAVHGTQLSDSELARLADAGATLVLALASRDRLYWASVGDSSLFVLRRGVLLRATEPHSVAWQTAVVNEKTGQVPPPRNVLCPRHGDFRRD